MTTETLEHIKNLYSTQDEYRAKSNEFKIKGLLSDDPNEKISLKKQESLYFEKMSDINSKITKILNQEQ